MIFKLRPASDNDLEFCMSIGHEGIRPYVEELFGWDQDKNERDFISDWDIKRTWKIEHNGKMVGYLKKIESPEEIVIDGIYISKGWRNKELGESVLKSILSKSTKTVSLKVYKNNPAFKLYKQLKFVVVKECELRYYMTWEPKTLNQ